MTIHIDEANWLPDDDQRPPSTGARGGVAPVASAGRRIGRLVVGARRNALGRVVCACDCGETIALTDAEIEEGRTYQCSSCSDYQTRSPARQIVADDAVWKILMDRGRGARRRCEVPECKDYPSYGGRGIQFRYDSVEMFALHMWMLGFRAGDERTTERIDVNGHYEPGNVRLATPTEQAWNKRTSRVVRTAWGDRPFAEVMELFGHRPGDERFKAVSDRFLNGMTTQDLRAILDDLDGLDAPAPAAAHTGAAALARASGRPLMVYSPDGPVSMMSVLGDYGIEFKSPAYRRVYRRYEEGMTEADLRAVIRDQIGDDPSERDLCRPAADAGDGIDDIPDLFGAAEPEVREID
ncbi:hypothetical protein [Paracoccus sanguinis]|uniref:hypothetical protein n=1 Tax=Paracoccus sanguinis TaxID=1545044 RepID=UPI0012E07948|nr:hypothetical protein [Paracoccus sanguinis]